ncbi:MAG: hypothetical protein ICV84_19230 [Flavisolibacter sp.]|nr:hypothetical protein [Flavisolibacter sp.]
MQQHTQRIGNRVILLPLPMNLFDKIGFNKPEEIALTQQNTLRKVVGFLGIDSPVFLLIDTGYGKPLPSISHYYFTRVGGIFMITVSLLAIFLLICKGRNKLNFAAGIFCLLWVENTNNGIRKVKSPFDQLKLKPER